MKKYASLGVYAKAIIGAVLSALAAANLALQTGGTINSSEWLTVGAVLVAGTYPIWQADNERWFKYAKAVATGVVALLGSLAVAIVGGTLDPSDIIQAVITAFGAAGLIGAVVPNAVWSDLLHEEPQPEDYDLPDVDSFHTVTLTNDEDGDFRDDETGRFLPRV